MDREYYMQRDGKIIRIFGTTYGILNDKREGRYIGKIYYDEKLKEIIFQAQLGIMGQSEEQIKYLNQLIKDYGDELKNGEQKILWQSNLPKRHNQRKNY